MGKRIFRQVHHQYSGGYSINFVNISNINDVYASTGQFDATAASSVKATAAGSTASGSTAGSVSVT